MALKQQGQKTRWNGDKPHTVLKMPVTLNANRGRAYSSDRKPPHLFEIQTRDVQTAHKEGLIVAA